MCSSLFGNSFLRSYLLFFFFFQAEDGIRDIGVTGVQTCALPIYVVLAVVSGGLRQLLRARGERVDDAELRAMVPVSVRADHDKGALGNQVASLRSEERRVGKECRSRRSPYH